MGTSGAYGGSGGRAWSAARQQAAEFADNPTDENAEQLLSDIADAVDWDREEPDPAEQEGERPVVPRFEFGPQPLRVRGASGRSDGPGGGAGGAGRTAGGGGGSGGGRSRTRAAAVGGAVAGAGLAYRDRDQSALDTFGLSLAELDAVGPFERSKRILAAAGATVGGLDEDELALASSRALLGLLEDDGLSGADAVRLFVVEYVYAVSLTEIGDAVNDGSRDGFTRADEEDKLRNLIEIAVGQIELPDEIRGREVQEAVFSALDDARTYLRAGR